MKMVLLIIKTWEINWSKKQEHKWWVSWKHFQIQGQGALLKKLKKSKNNEERNNTQVVMINSALRDLKEETEDISEQEKEIENPNEIIDIIEKILKFNIKQQGQGSKILTPNQMLSRLPISLA